MDPITIIAICIPLGLLALAAIAGALLYHKRRSRYLVVEWNPYASNVDYKVEESDEFSLEDDNSLEETKLNFPKKGFFKSLYGYIVNKFREIEMVVEESTIEQVFTESKLKDKISDDGTVREDINIHSLIVGKEETEQPRITNGVMIDFKILFQPNQKFPTNQDNFEKCIHLNKENEEVRLTIQPLSPLISQ